MLGRSTPLGFKVFVVAAAMDPVWIAPSARTPSQPSCSVSKESSLPRPYGAWTCHVAIHPHTWTG
eukprot:5168731-Amphidinium_carterae.1